MHIQNLSLIGFKNYDEISLEFSEKINCLVGPNGSGKTNILDAIHYLSLSKSAFNTSDSQNINHDSSFFSIKADFRKEGRRVEVLCALQKGSKKVLKIDKKEYDKLSEHIGKFPVVLMEPYDTDLIRGASELRRKFFDTLISQLDKDYLKNLIAYGANLKQRNALLKNFSTSGNVDIDLLEPYTQRLLELGEFVNKKRSHFISKYSKQLIERYKHVSKVAEHISIEYYSEFNEQGIESKIRNSLKKELILERTSMGVHKDDYKFYINGEAIKKFGSQGQQKSFVIALKLSHYDSVKKEKGINPILLLDDIFDKLDAQRVSNLIEIITDEGFGQVFITDSHEDRIPKILKKMNVEPFTFKVSNGKILE